MISVLVTLSGHITAEAVEAAQDYVRDATGGGTPKTTLLGPLKVLVGGHGPGRQ
jgi:hypothetical protein